MIDLHKLSDELEAAMISDDPLLKEQFIMDNVPQLINEYRDLLHERNALETRNLELETQLMENQS